LRFRSSLSGLVALLTESWETSGQQEQSFYTCDKLLLKIPQLNVMVMEKVMCNIGLIILFSLSCQGVAFAFLALW
jgi:hypothetical protein